MSTILKMNKKPRNLLYLTGHYHCEKGNGSKTSKTDRYQIRIQRCLKCLLSFFKTETDQKSNYTRLNKPKNI